MWYLKQIWHSGSSSINCYTCHFCIQQNLLKGLNSKNYTKCSVYFQYIFCYIYISVYILLLDVSVHLHETKSGVHRGFHRFVPNRHMPSLVPSTTLLYPNQSTKFHGQILGTISRNTELGNCFPRSLLRPNILAVKTGKCRERAFRLVPLTSLFSELARW